MEKLIKNDINLSIFDSIFIENKNNEEKFNAIINDIFNNYYAESILITEEIR